jgi:biopolymer transport protein ExbD
VKFRENTVPRQVELQLAPMVDVVFLLLMYFVVTWNFAKFESEVNIAVPKAEESSASEQSPGEIVISVAPDGRVSVNNQLMSREQLADKLARVAALFPGQAVILKGDGEAEFTYVMAVLDLCQKSGIWNVAFASDQPSPSR